jgi:hypothetical protein
MYLVEKVELLVYNRMTGGHEKGHWQVEGLHKIYNEYNFCNSLVIRLCTKCAYTTLEGFDSAARTCLFSSHYRAKRGAACTPQAINPPPPLRPSQYTVFSSQ